ncbi:hypothetical protein [Shewanella sp.]|uniref:hypothetical protein n=1 Tax=Shewanella sp. TaxID=50422 RepID=UPI0040476E29
MGYKPRSKPRKTITKAAPLKKSTKKAINQIVDKKMNRVIETKAVDYVTEEIILNHNVPQTIDNDVYYSFHGVSDNANAQSSGTAFGNRIGDSLYAKSAYIRMYFDQYVDRPNLSFRITALRIKSGVNIISPASNAFAHPQSNNYFINPVDTENLLLYSSDPVVMDKRYVVNNGLSLTGNNKAFHFFKDFSIKLNRKLKYSGNSPNVVGPFTIQIIVTAYDSFGSLTTDNVSRLIYGRRSYYQDA